MFGLKPPLYYLPGKRAVRLRGSARRRRAPAPTPHGPGAPRLRWGTGSADPRGREGGRARGPAAPAAVRPAGCAYVRRGAPTRPAAPAAPPPGVRVSLLLSARSRLRGGGAARGRGHRSPARGTKPGCEVTLLQAARVGWQAPPAHPRLRGGSFSAPSRPPVWSPNA